MSVLVEITDLQDERLNGIVPSYLQGERKAKSRAQWGIDKLFELLGSNGHSNDREDKDGGTRGVGSRPPA